MANACIELVTLPQSTGIGEFDPMFIITKLGAKVNRVIVAGMLERLDPRETSNGSTRQGHQETLRGYTFSLSAIMLLNPEVNYTIVIED